MRSSSRPSPEALLCALWLVAVGLTAAGCHRAAKPELGPDRTVEAGVPVELGSSREGAPTVTWEFGDGSPQQTASRVSHAYARVGTYTVRALEEGQEVGRAQLTVVPRPLTRAIPADAQVALYLPRLRGAVEPMVDFYERLVGADTAWRQLEEAPFLPLILQSLRDGPSPVDPEEGFGFFMMPDFSGVVALVGVTDGPAALEAVLKDLEAGGYRLERPADGSVRAQFAEDDSLTLFLDRGYLYAIIPDEEDFAKEGDPRPLRQQIEAAVSALRQRISGFTGPGLSEVPLLLEMRPRVAEGSVYLYTAFPREDSADDVRGMFASLRVQQERLELEGFAASTGELFGGLRGPASELLSRAPLGPVAAAMVSLPPERLADLVFGAPGSTQHAQALEKLRAQGIEAKTLAEALRGDVALLVYFDAPAFYRNFLVDKRPEPRGSILLEAGLRRAEPVVALLTQALQGQELDVEVVREKDVTRFQTRILAQPLTLTVSADRLRVQAGEALDSRPREDVGRALRERFGAATFGEGHLSLMVDMGRLRAEMDAPQQVPGVPSGQLGAVKAFGGAFLDQLTPFDHAFLDIAPVQGGAQLRGRLVLRAR